ncbi:MAG: cytochrome c oxidase accessory protein CcoG [Vicingaceae bacterium]
MEHQLYEPDESFRDSISTINEEGKRSWIYPKKPIGRYYNARSLVSYLLLIILFSAPFIRIDGEPLIMMNIIERKFVIFGQIFWPQDFYLFVLAMLTFILFIILFTVVFGRLFCGWICPQTIFMEMVFRKIEYWIEGDYRQQRSLDNAPWNAEKIRKRMIKWSIFFIISFLISNIFLAYIIGSDELIKIITDPPSEHIQGLSAMFIFTGVFYFVFAWFREQVCIVVCPYGRLQGVMLDAKSVVVAYDYIRGEIREKFRKGEDRRNSDKGDCIDCKQCVYVCPTGIDIRNGTQLECINCTACMDACDDIMDKVGLERGLIRYDSEKGIAEKEKWSLTARTMAYSFVLLLLMSAFGFLLASRNDVEASLLRTPGMLYQKKEDNRISNLYNLKIINKTNQPVEMELKLLNIKGEIQLVGNEGLILEPQGVTEGVLFILLDRDELKSMKTEVEVGVFSKGELIESVETNFMGPAK